MGYTDGAAIPGNAVLTAETNPGRRDRSIAGCEVEVEVNVDVDDSSGRRWSALEKQPISLPLSSCYVRIYISIMPLEYIII